MSLKPTLFAINFLFKYKIRIKGLAIAYHSISLLSTRTKLVQSIATNSTEVSLLPLLCRGNPFEVEVDCSGRDILTPKQSVHSTHRIHLYSTLGIVRRFVMAIKINLLALLGPKTFGFIVVD